MAIGKEIKKGHIAGFKDEISKAASASDDDFFTWFDNAADKDAAFAKGIEDVATHITGPAFKFVSNPEDLTALEIGHGGGRLLAAASVHFKEVIGIDIHEHNKKVEDELKRRGINNFRLIKADGTGIPLKNDSVDFIYSFIVLQHVEKYEIFRKYIEEAYRILKSSGIAVIYFGRKKMLSANKSSKLRFRIDRFIEPLLLSKGYRELPAKVNVTNLEVSLSHAKSLAEKIGFKILSELVSYKEGRGGKRLFGGQNGLALKKP